MDNVTTVLGNILRAFQKGTCAAFQTCELKREWDAHVRREQKKKSSSQHISVPTVLTSHNTVTPLSSPTCQPQTNQLAGSQASGTVLDTTGAPDLRQEPAHHSTTRRAKTLNLNTYKHHVLGDYANTIRRYGTTDSYSTESASISFRVCVVPPMIAPPG